MNTVNQGLVDMLEKRIKSYDVLWYVYRQLNKEIPQLNEQTNIQVLENYFANELALPVYYDNARDWGKLWEWYPKHGLLAMLQRWRAKIHKWLSDAPYKLHPFDAPPGWRPMDISAIGHINISPSRALSSGCRVLELKRLVCKYAYFGDWWCVYIGYTYDPITDTLYMRNLETNRMADPRNEAMFYSPY